MAPEEKPESLTNSRPWTIVILIDLTNNHKHMSFQLFDDGNDVPVTDEAEVTMEEAAPAEETAEEAATEAPVEEAPAEEVAEGSEEASQE